MSDDKEGPVPERVSHEIVQAAPATRLILDKAFVAKMHGATPSVENLEKFTGTNVAPVTVTNFLKGQEGQVIKIRGDGQMTITHGTKIKTSTAANKLLTADKMYNFTYISGIWYEDADDGGGGIGPTGPAGAIGPIGPPMMDMLSPEEPMIIPGSPGTPGSAGSPGASIIGPMGAPGQDADPPEDAIVIPGPMGPSGIGIRGIPGQDADPPEDPQVIPGPVGPSGAAIVTLLTAEVSLATAPRARRGGRFDIAGSGMTVGKPVLIGQANGPYTGKGTLEDEAEMDQVTVTGKVFSATVIRCYWESNHQVRGNFKFDYAVSA